MNFQFVIKTFERRESISRLLESLSKFYPQAKAWIADDSKNPQTKAENPNHTFIPCPFDVGLKCGRQVALACVSTPYFVLLDDDFVLTEDTRIEMLIDSIESMGLDFCGGEVYDGDGKSAPRCFTGMFIEEPGRLNVIPCKDDALVKRTHVLANFYAAKTDSIRSLGGWDCRLKIWGHEDIFIRAWKAGMKVAFDNRVSVNHFPTPYENYKKFRDRAPMFWPAIAFEKFGYKSGNMWPEDLFGAREVEFGDPVGKWEPLFREEPNPRSFGDIESYSVACGLLDNPGLVEDWGCGCGYARRFFKLASYVGVDGSYSEHCDVVDDLRTRSSNPDGILIRHILEHNIRWMDLLKNALKMAKRKVVIVFFLPFSTLEGEHKADDRGIVTFSLCRDAVLDVLKHQNFSVSEQIMENGEVIWECSRIA